MARRITTGKRDREKLKEQKRKLKQERKEERQNSGTSSFEDMIMYVDQNGQFSTTPPDKNIEEEIELEDIAISVSRQEDEEVDDNPVRQGVVEFFNSSKGFGFIIDKANQAKYFFHISAAPKDIQEGDRVSFELEEGAKGMNAVKIALI